MALKKIISKKQTVEFISEKDPDKSNPTKFILGEITAEEMADINSELIKFKKTDKTFEVEDTLNFKDFVNFYKKVCIYGIKEVKNLEGYQWKGTVDNELLEILLANDILVEIGTKILELNSLSVKEEKN